MNRLELLVVDPFDRPENVSVPSTSGPDEDWTDDEDGYRLPGRELLIVIDGGSELDRWGGVGLAPNDLSNPDQPLLPPADGSAIELVVQRCSCGEVGCGSLTATIARQGDAVVWTFDEEQGTQREIGPFEFDADQYEEEVRRAHDVRPWESHDEHVARLVEEALLGRGQSGQDSFDWATPRPAGTVLVSMTHREPNPRAGRRTGEIGRGPGWVGYTVEPDELRTQHLGAFPIGNHLDAEAAAARILLAIERTDPSSWPRPEWL